ncbi:MAG TPA: hypothetical protein VKZ53_28040 [Candidatus Angelobacter sp.]|nr:hypothetical protein [Candidatus Angelobacter sp.]
MTHLRIPVFLLSIPLLLSISNAQETGNVARLVVWQAKPGMTRDLEEGYKRHLDWHRRNNDSWVWRGWTIVSGEHDGYFVDGTFFHTWTDLDSPVSPAGDAADNEMNVFPYGDARAAIYEAVSTLSNLRAVQMDSRLLTFCHFQVRPGGAEEFEARIARELNDSPLPHILLRPAIGAGEYILLLPAQKISELALQTELTRKLLRASSKSENRDPLVEHFRTELAVYRSDLSYIPGKAK